METTRNKIEGGGMPSLDRAAQYLVQLAEQRAQEMEHAAASLQHLLLALLDRYLPMVESLSPNLDWPQYRNDLQSRLKTAAPTDDVSLESVLSAARAVAQSEDLGEVRLRHLCLAILQVAGVPLGSKAAATGEVLRRTGKPPPISRPLRKRQSAPVARTWRAICARSMCNRPVRRQLSTSTA